MNCLMSDVTNYAQKFAACDFKTRRIKTFLNCRLVRLKHGSRHEVTKKLSFSNRFINIMVSTLHFSLVYFNLITSSSIQVLADDR